MILLMGAIHNPFKLQGTLSNIRFLLSSYSSLCLLRGDVSPLPESEPPIILRIPPALNSPILILRATSKAARRICSRTPYFFYIKQLQLSKLTLFSRDNKPRVHLYIKCSFYLIILITNPRYHVSVIFQHTYLTLKQVSGSITAPHRLKSTPEAPKITN